MKNIIILAVVVAGIALIGLSTYKAEEVIVHKEVEHVEVLPEWISEDCESCKEAYQKEQKRLELKAKEQELVDQIVGLQSELDTVRNELTSL